MEINEKLVQKVKTYLRINHSALDSDLQDAIAACLRDLGIGGVATPADDPLILNAVKLYCKAAYIDDPVKSAAYQARYNDLKACLSMAGEYREEAEQ